MSDQLKLRRQIAGLEATQATRRRVVAQRKQELDDNLAFHDRKIANLKQQLTIGVAR